MGIKRVLLRFKPIKKLVEWLSESTIEKRTWYLKSVRIFHATKNSGERKSFFISFQSSLEDRHLKYSSNWGIEAH